MCCLLHPLRPDPTDLERGRRWQVPQTAGRWLAGREAEGVRCRGQGRRTPGCPGCWAQSLQHVGVLPGTGV